jgi:hypothetical protein
MPIASLPSGFGADQRLLVIEKFRKEEGRRGHPDGLSYPYGSSIGCVRDFRRSRLFGYFVRFTIASSAFRGRL